MSPFSVDPSPFVQHAAKHLALVLAFGLALLPGVASAQASTQSGPTGPSTPPPAFSVTSATATAIDRITVTVDVEDPGRTADFKVSDGGWEFSAAISNAIGTAGVHTVELSTDPMAEGEQVVQIRVYPFEDASPAEVALEYATFSVGAMATDTYHNAVWSETARVPVTTEAELDVLSIAQGELARSVTFADEMGRTRQTIAEASAPATGDDFNRGDVVTVTEYDELGRQTKTRLPYVSKGPAGAFKVDADVAQEAFYEAPPSRVERIDRPFSEVQLRESPLQVPVEATSAGNDAGRGARATVRTEHRTNTVADGVWRWTVNYRDNETESAEVWWGGGSSGDPGSPTHDPATLYVTTTTDANGRVSEEFKNKSGQAILKRTYEGYGTAEEVRHDTYYLYDDHGRLRFILPPSGVEFLANPDGSPNTSVGFWKATGHYTKYVYDYAGREVEKHIPEEEPVYSVYDDLGRVVARQDGPLRNEHSWLFTKYDVHGREVMTGIWRHDGATTRRQVQDLVLTGRLPDGTQAYTFELHEERVACATDLDPSKEGAYTDTAFPQLEAGRVELLTQHYYDDYLAEYEETATPIWLEDFALPDGSTTDQGATSWSAQAYAEAYAGFSVEGEAFNAVRLPRPDGSPPDPKEFEHSVAWVSAPIDISGHANVRVSAEVSAQGRFDYLGGATWMERVQLWVKIDGKPEVLVDEFFDHGNPLTLRADGLSGNSLIVVLRFRISSQTTDHLAVDNVQVEGVTEAPASCSLVEAVPFVQAFNEEDRADVEHEGLRTEHLRGFARSGRTLGKPTHSLVRVLHATESYLPGRQCETGADPNLTYVTDLKAWTESLEAAAWANGTVSVTDTEVQGWIDLQASSVDASIMTPEEQTAFNQLNNWLVSLRNVATADGGTATLDGPTLDDYNTSLAQIEAIVRDAALGRCEAGVEAFSGTFDESDLDALLAIDLDSLQTALGEGAVTAQQAGYSVPLRDWMASTMFYDRHGQLIQTVSDGHLAERRDVASTAYSFDGRAVQTVRDHLTLPDASVGRGQRVRVREEFAYDHTGRPHRHWRNVMGEAGFVLAEETAYNALGQVTTRRLHGDLRYRDFAQTLHYRYHPRGWLASVRSDTSTYRRNTLTDEGLLALDFYYDLGSGLPNHTPLYDGTITGLRWQAPPSIAASLDGPAGGAYAYHYDDLGRLIAGRHADYDPATGAYTAAERYSLAGAAYDGNGNLTSLVRCGPGGTAHPSCPGGAIDALTYHYEEGHRYEGITDAAGNAVTPWDGTRANRLIAVDDAASQALGFSDGGSFYSQIAPGRVGDAEYWYNGNGANRRDDGKGLGHVFYAVNSLPRVAFFPTTADGVPGTVEWTYAATGGRLRRVVTLDGAATETVDYAGGLVLKAGLIEFMSTGQGRLKAGYATGSGGQTGKKIGGWAHEYLLRDHLGSVRARFETAPRLTVAMTTARALATVGQYDEYYPYGLRLAGRSYVVGDADDELFHGKRLDEGHGLDWTHYGWRYYDAAVGRWVMVDPADEFYTAYSYVGGDPVNLVDPNGAQINASQVNDPAAQDAWGQVARTDWGYSFLSRYARAGQEVFGVRFESDGIFSENELVLQDSRAQSFTSFGVRMENGFPILGGAVQTAARNSPSNAMSNIIVLIGINPSQSAEIHGAVEYEDIVTSTAVTIAHEITLHAERSASLMVAAYSDDLNIVAQAFARRAESSGFKGSSHHKDYLDGSSRASRVLPERLETLVPEGDVGDYLRRHDSNLQRSLDE